MVTMLSRHAAFRQFRLPAVAHPFADGRDKYKVDDTLIAPILEDFDRRIVPWARGDISRSGETRQAFIARLDAEDTDASEKKARLRAAQAKRRQRSGKSGRPEGKSDAEKLAMNGFLTQKANGRTARSRHAAAMSPRLRKPSSRRRRSSRTLSRSSVIRSSSTPQRRRSQTPTKGTFSSGYVASVLKAMKKIARDYYEASPDHWKRSMI